jgi:hypothetical protein
VAANPVGVHEGQRKHEDRKKRKASHRVTQKEGKHGCTEMGEGGVELMGRIAKTLRKKRRDPGRQEAVEDALDHADGEDQIVHLVSGYDIAIP